MTVSSSTSSASYTGNGTTTAFAVPFYFLQDDQILAQRVDLTTGAATALVLGADYTLSGAGSTSGGTLTMTVAPTSNQKLTVQRTVPLVQQTAYPDNGPFPASSHERALDYLTMAEQETRAVADAALAPNALADGWDALSRKLQSVADGVAATDATSLGQVQQLVAGAASGLTPDDIALLSSLASSAPGKGASLVTYQQPGAGGVARSVQAALQGVVVNVKAFGAKGDGATDDTDAFNAAVTYVASLGGGRIHVPAGTYVISSMITVTTNGVVFVGDGFDTQHDVGVQAHPTLIQWAGGTDEAMFKFSAIAGASNKALAGCGLLDIALNGTNGATYVKTHVKVVSHRQGRFRFFGTGSSDWVLQTAVVDTLGEATDTQYNVFEVWGRQFNSGGGGVQLFGVAYGSGNTSFNRLPLVDLQINTGTGLELGDSDTNFIDVIRVTGVTSGKAYDFLGSNVAPGHTARGNFIGLMSSSGPGYARGTTSYTYASHSNYIGLDVGNATPFPTIEAGASCYYAQGGKDPYKFAAAKAAFADSMPDAQSARDAMGNESVRVYNASQNHIVLDDGTDVWSINIESGGDLGFTHVSGTSGASFRLPAGWHNNADAAVNGYIQVRDANGNLYKLATIA